jgi:hypothetical protein
MSDMDFELFPGKDLGGLFKDIYKNQQTKKRRISELIFDLKKSIRKMGDGSLNTNDIMMLYPIIKDLVDSSVKNDDSLLKMATIAQRIITAGSKSEGDTGFLTHSEKQQLLQEVKTLGEIVIDEDIEIIDGIEDDIERIKKEMIEDESED